MTVDATNYNLNVVMTA